jgi:hypothetical protein
MINLSLVFIVLFFKRLWASLVVTRRNAPDSVSLLRRPNQMWPALLPEQRRLSQGVIQTRPVRCLDTVPTATVSPSDSYDQVG